jgi:hypothetical protein
MGNLTRIQGMKNNSGSDINSQRGASGLVMLVMVLFFGSLLTLLLKLGPAYMDDYTIQEALEGLNDTEGLSEMGPAEVRTQINKRLSVNNVRTLDAKSITVDKDGDRVLIVVDYEVRSPLISNIDAVMHFKHAYDMSGQ